MPEIDWGLVAGLSVPCIYVAAAAGLGWALWRERRRPSSYTRRQAALREPAVVQEARDTAVLDAAEAAEDAARRAAEKAGPRNTLFHP